MKFVARCCLLLLTSGTMSGCGELSRSPTEPGGLPDPINPAATFRRVQSEVFTPSCALAGCHDDIVQETSQVLTPARAYADTVNRSSVQVPALKRIEPGSPERSYLFLKITGASGIVGDRMPLGRPALSTEQIALVRDWIRRGAPND